MAPGFHGLPKPRRCERARGCERAGACKRVPIEGARVRRLAGIGRHLLPPVHPLRFGEERGDRDATTETLTRAEEIRLRFRTRALPCPEGARSPRAGQHLV